jgi:tetrapyrrole methylase family protein/MazG family protein
MPKAPENLSSFQSLVEVVASLRGPDGCPWDREQTHSSLTQYAIEETFEFVEAVESADDLRIKDELGDILFQVLLHAQLAKDRGAFDIQGVIENLNQKMVRRHPHVFSDVKLADSEAVIQSWEQIKRAEKASAPKMAGTALDVPAGMPALQRAYKIGKRSQKLQFDWDNAEQVWEKVEEEHQELREAIDEKSLDEVSHELGDVLFSVAQLARHLQLEPEQCLRQANLRFETRFAKMRELMLQDGKILEDLGLEEKEAYWQRAKQLVK